MNNPLDAVDTTRTPPDYEPLTVLPVVGDPTRFYCLGEAGWWYEVRIAADEHVAECECPHRRYRGARCKHIAAAERFVAEGKRAAADSAVQWFLGLSEEDRKAIWR